MNFTWFLIITIVKWITATLSQTSWLSTCGALKWYCLFFSFVLYVENRASWLDWSSRQHEEITESCRYLFLVASYWRFTTKSPYVFSIHFLQQVINVIKSSWEGHRKMSVFTSRSSKLLKVHNKATANCQYLFLAARLLKVQVVSISRISRS